MAPETQKSLRLITIPVSHYCEKARWALERAGLAYTEIRHVQFFHYFSTLLHARSIYAPALLTPDEAVVDSTDILHFADRYVAPKATLFPEEAELAEPVRRWEEWFDGVLGVETRRWMYHACFEQMGDDAIIAFAAQGTPSWQAALMKPFMPFAKTYTRYRLKVEPPTVDRGLQLVGELFERVGRELSDGREYLVGGRFTAADLTFASLSAFVLMPPEYTVRFPDIASLPSPMRDVVERFRDTRAGRFALHLFARERRAQARECSPSMQSDAHV
jgi:glutathione S-transferase